MSVKRPQPRIGQNDRPYWQFAANDELRVQACSRCGHLRYPPGPVCPQCLAEETEWRLLSGRGRVVTWTTFHRAYFPDIPVPYTVVSVETVEGPLLIGNLVDGEGVEPAVGLPVRAVFEDVLFGAEPGRLCQWAPLRNTTPDT
jgi:uncharacterized OB-fold protein